MGPPSNHDYFEIGRSVATLMSDKIFHDLAYSAKSRDDILAAINSFLDDSIVLAPGDWDRHLLLPLLQAEISEKRRERIKLLKEQGWLKVIYLSFPNEKEKRNLIFNGRVFTDIWINLY